MRFELARMFLMHRAQADAFSRRNPDGSEMSRGEWLRAVFLERIDFIHRNAPRRYDPDVQQIRDNRIISRIGKQIVLRESDPDNYLREMKRTQWRACLVIIDPVSHSDGQKVAIEASSAIGSGFGNFESLIASINSRTPPEPFVIELHSITNQDSFWDYVKRNEGMITSITLEVAMPNMFGGESSFEEDVRRLRDREKARRVKETIENPEGLQPDTDRMREAVSYATRGGGKVKAKAKDAAPYDSTEDKKFLEVEIDSDHPDVDEKTSLALAAFEKDTSDEQNDRIEKK
jgi:hypothetical protein